MFLNGGRQKLKKIAALPANLGKSFSMESDAMVMGGFLIIPDFGSRVGNPHSKVIIVFLCTQRFWMWVAPKDYVIRFSTTHSRY